MNRNIPDALRITNYVDDQPYCQREFTIEDQSYNRLQGERKITHYPYRIG